MADSILPNPFNKDNTITGVAKKAEVISQSISLTGKIIKSIILFIFFLIFSIVAKIPLAIFFIVAGLNIGAILATGIIQVISIRKVISMNVDKEVKTYTNMIVQSQRYSALGSTVIVFANLAAFLISMSFFNEELGSIMIGTIALKYWLIILSAMVVSYGLADIIRYQCVKDLINSSDIVDADKKYAVTTRKLSLMKILPIAALILSLIYFVGRAPLYAILIPAVMIMSYVALTVLSIRKIQGIDTEKTGDIDQSIARKKIISYEKEQAVGAVFGITKTMASLKDIFKPFGSATLGVGKTYYPENTIIFTNYRIILTQVPVTGGNLMMNDTNYAQNNFYYNRKEIRAKGEQLLSQGMQGVIPFALDDFLYGNIKKATLKYDSQIIIETRNGEKYSYVFPDKEYAQTVKRVLSFYLKERFN